MSTPRLWLGISNREWLINSNTPQLLTPGPGATEATLPGSPSVTRNSWPAATNSPPATTPSPSPAHPAPTTPTSTTTAATTPDSNSDTGAHRWWRSRREESSVRLGVLNSTPVIQNHPGFLAAMMTVSRMILD
jgi:hypothetical protein